MPTPDFILTLRERIGHDLLWLSGVCGIVLDDAPDEQRVLLTLRPGWREWTLVTGILEPGEQPAPALVREVREETGVDCVVEELVAVVSDEGMTLPNRDQCQFLTLTFRCRYLSGRAAVGDDENADVAWFPLTDLPPLSGHTRERLGYLTSGVPLPYFHTDASS